VLESYSQCPYSRASTNDLGGRSRMSRLCRLVASVATIITIGFLPTTAYGTSAVPHCGKPTSFGKGNNWKMDCATVFSNGPRVKTRYVQTGSTLKVRACAYGRVPKGFKNLSLVSQLEETNDNQVVDLKVHRGSCSLPSRPAATRGSLEHGMHVTADTTLFWDKSSLTGSITYKVA
jgi:hypothetical protein